MVWFIPLVIGGAVAVVGTIKLAWDYFSKKEVLLLLHGEMGVGKSTIISTLSGKKYEAVTAQHEKVDISSISKNAKVEFKAIAMIDVGGNQKKENEEVRETFFSSNALRAFLYVFDAEKFEENEKYQYGLETYKKKCEDYNKNCEDYNVLFYAIGTRADKFAIKEQKETLEKRIRRDFGVQTYIINAQNKSEVLEIYANILKTMQEKYQ